MDQRRSRLIRSFVIAEVVALAVMTPGIAIAAEPNSPAADNRETATIGETVKKAHDRIEQNILEQVIHFDDFFGSVKSESERKTEYQLRWRNALRLDNSGHLSYGTNLRASLVLSKISDRLRLVIAGEDEAQSLSPNLPQDPGAPGYDRTLAASTRLINTELRLGLIKTPSSDLFLGGGFRIDIPIQLFVRSRFQYIHNLDDLSHVRFAETLFVNNSAGFGETSEVGLERLLPAKILLRWANSGTVSEKISGMEWGSELSCLRELSPKSAITMGGGVYGNTSSAPAVTTYRIFTRYRRNILVHWLFYELEPEVFWPRESSGAFVANYAVTGRLEIVFQGVSAEATGVTRSLPPVPAISSR